MIDSIAGVLIALGITVLLAAKCLPCAECALVVREMSSAGGGLAVGLNSVMVPVTLVSSIDVRA